LLREGAVAAAEIEDAFAGLGGKEATTLEARLATNRPLAA
jgi:hypothetical protein